MPIKAMPCFHTAWERRYIMRKRVLTNIYRRQFAIIPTFGIIKYTEDYRFRIGFMWGIWQLSIGCFREKED